MTVPWQAASMIIGCLSTCYLLPGADLGSFHASPSFCSVLCLSPSSFYSSWTEPYLAPPPNTGWVCFHITSAKERRKPTRTAAKANRSLCQTDRFQSFLHFEVKLINCCFKNLILSTSKHGRYEPQRHKLICMRVRYHDTTIPTFSFWHGNQR